MCSLTPERAALAEYEAFKDMQCEIQVRSILQHAWAEIEHDLGYKTKEAIPVQSQRRFARLAGLLELADDEFRGIRNDLEAYAETVGFQIAKDASKVQIDKDSIAAYLAQDAQLLRLGAQMAAYEARELAAEDPEPYAGSLAVWLTYAGLETIQDVQQAVEDEAELMIKYHQRHIALLRASGLAQKGVLPKSHVPFRLGLVLIARRGEPSDIIAGIKKAGYSVVNDEEFAQSAVSALLEVEATP